MSMLDTLDLELYLADPGPYTLDRDPLDAGGASGGRGGSEGGPTLGPDDAWSWTPVLGAATDVEITRGGRREGVAVELEPGTFQVRLDRDQLQAALGLPPGGHQLATALVRPATQLRATHRPTGRRVFTGQVLDVWETYRREQGPGRPPTVYVHLLAVDAVHSLANTDRYGAASGDGDGEPWHHRIHRLMRSAPGVPYTVTPESDLEGRFMLDSTKRGVLDQDRLGDYEPDPGPWLCADIAYESTLATHLDVACRTCAAVWWVDPTGWARFLRGDLEGPVATLTDTPVPPHAARRQGESYVDVTTAYDTREVVTALTLENLTREREDGRWSSVTTALGPFIDDTARATFGARRATVTTSLYLAGDDGPAHTLAHTLATARQPHRAVTGLRLNDPNLATRLDVHDQLVVDLDGARHQVRVVNLHHTITPERWTTELVTAPN